jgi:hypothetical protein
MHLATSAEIRFEALDALQWRVATVAIVPAEPDSVIGRMGEVLARAEVPFGGSNRSMAEKELNLL